MPPVDESTFPSWSQTHANVILEWVELHQDQSGSWWNPFTENGRPEIYFWTKWYTEGGGKVERRTDLHCVSEVGRRVTFKTVVATVG